MEDDKTAGTMMEVGLGCYVRSAFQAIASTPWDEASGNSPLFDSSKEDRVGF